MKLLRQWACINSLLEQSFHGGVEGQLGQDSRHYIKVDTDFDNNFARFTLKFSPQDVTEHPIKLDDLLNKSMGSIAALLDKQSNLLIRTDVKDVPDLVVIEVLLNGDIHVAEQQVFPGPIPARNGSGPVVNDEEKLQRLAKDLDIAGDIDTFVEWIRYLTRKGQSHF